MPEDLLDKENPSENDNIFQPRTITFRREVVPSDWTRFDYYAPFVRHLGATGLQELSSSAFLVIDDVISQALKERQVVLLPNLKTFVVSSNDLPYTSLFLAPTVRSLRLLMRPSHLQQLSYLATEIPRKAPNLKVLHLCQSTQWKEKEKVLFAHALRELLQGLDLEEFHCDWFPLSDEMTSALLGMHSVRALTVCKDVLALSQILETKPIPQPQMNTLVVWTDNLNAPSLQTIIARIRPSKLATFRVTFSTGRCTQDNLHGLILAIATHCSTTSFVDFSLEEVTLREQVLNITGEDDVSPCAVAFPILKPLFQFSHLRQLSLMWPFDFTDAEMKEMARSWPQIETLCYETARRDIEPRTTLVGLMWLATYCRRLKSLTYSFKGSCVLSDELIAGAAGHDLSFLSVGRSPIDDPREVSDFLNTVFPNLSLILWTDAPNSENGERWQEVEAQIQRV